MNLGSKDSFSAIESIIFREKCMKNSILMIATIKQVIISHNLFGSINIVVCIEGLTICDPSIMMTIIKENRSFRSNYLIIQVQNLMGNNFLSLILNSAQMNYFYHYLQFVLILTNLGMFSKQSKEEVSNGKLTLDYLTKIQLAESEESMIEEGDRLFNINDTLIPNSPPPSSNQYASQQDYDIDGFFNLWPEINEGALEIIPEEIEDQQISQESSQAFSTSEAARMSNTSAQSCLTGNFQPETKKNQEKKSRKIRQIDDEDMMHESKSKKNIIGYIAKKSIKVVLKKYRSKLKRDCQKSGVSFIDFLNFYEDYEQKLYGPEKLAIMLRISKRESEQTKKMKSIFYVYFEKVLRRDYLIETVKSGKMADLQSYLCKKNRCLLYFAESIQES